MKANCPLTVGSFHLDEAAAKTGKVRYRTTDNEWTVVIYGLLDNAGNVEGKFYNLRRRGDGLDITGSSVYKPSTPIEVLVSAAEVELAARLAGVIEGDGNV